MNRDSFLGSFKKPKMFWTLEEKEAKAKEDIYGWLTSAFGGSSDIDWKNYTVYGNEKMIDERRFRISIYLGDQRYSFSVSIKKEGKNYLGGTASTTYYRPGENWTRGSDLPDGEFSKETFDAIIKAILGYQFRRIETTSGKIESQGDIEFGRANQIGMRQNAIPLRDRQAEQEVLNILDGEQDNG